VVLWLLWLLVVGLSGNFLFFSNWFVVLWLLLCLVVLL